MTTENQAPEGAHYTVERHGNGWAIYTGRDHQHHGCNWGQLTECDDALAKLIERGLNLAALAAQPQAEPLALTDERLHCGPCESRCCDCPIDWGRFERAIPASLTKEPTNDR